jgi:hypothetical protein
MVQKIDLQRMPTKSRGLDRGGMPEACQRLPRRSEIHYVAIRRLRQKDTGHNWKVADIVPQPSLLISGEA